jgi:crossover junction endodeoxyribonuclease RuvC
MKILSMDLSLNGSALAVIELKRDKVEILEVVFVDNKKIKTHGYKLYRIREALIALLSKYEIDRVVRERGFVRFNKATQALYKVVGVVDEVLHEHGFKTLPEIPPTTVKAKVAKNGKADKEMVDRRVREYLIYEQQNYEFQTDDCSDAVAVGVALALQEDLLK